MTGFVQEDADRAEVKPYTPLNWSVMAVVERLVAQRCAPLVEALEAIRAEVGTSTLAYKLADAALVAYHAAQGAGRGTLCDCPVDDMSLDCPAHGEPT